MIMDRNKTYKKFGVSEDQLDAWAEEYETDAWDAPLGKVVMGRPSIAAEEVSPLRSGYPYQRYPLLMHMQLSVVKHALSSCER